MLRKIIGLIFTVLLFLHSKAQDQKVVNRLLANIKPLAATIAADSTLAPACSKFVQKVKQNIPYVSNKPLTKDAVQRLINRLAFTTDEGNATLKCDSLKLNGLIDSTKMLMAELNKLAIDSVVLSAKFNSNKNGTPGWTLSIDSLSPANAVNRLTIKDSMGYIQALLVTNNQKTVTVIPDLHNARDSAFKIHENPDKTFTLQVAPYGQLSKIAADPKLDIREPGESGGADLILYVLTFFLLLLMLALAFFYWKTAGNFKALSEKIAVLSRKTEMKTMQSHAAIPVDQNTIGPSIPPSLQEPAIIVTEIKNEPRIQTDAQFTCEIKMTAGPRKKPMSEPGSDKDLGEDVCGCVTASNELFIWLLDGTSDDDSWRNPATGKEYFSSRLLAQSIGDELRASYLEKRPVALDVMLTEAISEVKQEWLQAIIQLPDEERTLLKKKIEDKVFPQCSTTALIGHLEINGTLHAYRTGDSQMFLFKEKAPGELLYIETPLTEHDGLEADRIFFRLQLSSNKEFEIVSNKPAFDILEENEIHTMISFSDGIGTATERLLKEQYGAAPAKVRQDLKYQLQGTADDKSICFIERLAVR